MIIIGEKAFFFLLCHSQGEEKIVECENICIKNNINIENLKENSTIFLMWLYLESQKCEGLHVHTLRAVHNLLVLTTIP